MFPGVAVQYRNKYFRASCKFATTGGFLFAYFQDSRHYLDEDFTEEGDVVAYGGRLPNINALPGDVVRYSLDGTTFNEATITGTVWIPDYQVEAYLTDVPLYLWNPVDGLIEIAYNEKEANLYAQLISLASLPSGKFFIRREHGVQAYNIKFTSEPLDVQVSHEETLALVYRHEGIYNRPDLWNYVYLEDWTNVLRIPADFYKFAPSGELELDVNDFGVSRILRAVPYRQIELTFHNMPSWLADKLQIALSHDIKIVNGYEYEVENFGQFETIDRLDLGNYVVNLRQKNDRSKKTDTFTAAITAAFVPPEHLDIPFAGDTLESEFVTNTLGLFSFIALPAWITADVEFFENGDIVTFTIAANATLFERLETLVAICPDFDGLEAEITFAQVYDTTVPSEYLVVNTNNVTLAYPASSSFSVLVAASSGWTTANLSGFSFGGTIVGDYESLTIFSPTINDTGVNRVGVIRVSLISNPAVFQDITVTQLFAPPPPPQLISTLPTLWNSPNRYATRNFFITTETGCKWQVYTSEEWIHCSTVIHTGSATINIQIDEADFYDVPREGVATIVNILDPYDTLVIPIEQN